MSGPDVSNSFEVKDVVLQAKNPDKLAQSLHTTTNDIQTALEKYSKAYSTPRDMQNLATFLNTYSDPVDLMDKLGIQASKNVVAKTPTATGKGAGSFI